MGRDAGRTWAVSILPSPSRETGRNDSREPTFTQLNRSRLVASLAELTPSWLLWVGRSDSAGLEVVGQTDVDALVGEDGHLVDLGIVVLRLIELGSVEPGIDQCSRMRCSPSF